MKFNYFAPIILIASISMFQAVSANALATDAAKKVAPSVATKVVISGVARVVNSKALHNFGMRRSAKARALMKKNLSTVTGGLSGGSS